MKFLGLVKTWNEIKERLIDEIKVQNRRAFM